MLDETKVDDSHLFRTRYDPGFIVVSQNIANEFQKEFWSGILLQPTEQYGGI